MLSWEPLFYHFHNKGGVQLHLFLTYFLLEGGGHPFSNYQGRRTGKLQVGVFHLNIPPKFNLIKSSWYRIIVTNITWRLISCIWEVGEICSLRPDYTLRPGKQCGAGGQVLFVSGVTWNTAAVNSHPRNLPVSPKPGILLQGTLTENYHRRKAIIESA